MDNYNWSMTAGYHCQVSGLLAGFVFAAITVWLSSLDNEEIKKNSATIYSLFVTFFCLMVATFLFAATTGEKALTPNTTYVITSSCILCVGAVQMFLSMVWFLNNYGLNEQIASRIVCVFFAVLFIVALSIIVTITYAQCLLQLGMKNSQVPMLSDVLLWAFPIGVLPIIGAIVWWRRHNQLYASRNTNDLLRLSSLSIVLTVLATIGFELAVQMQASLLPIGSFWMRLTLALTLGVFFLLSIVALPCRMKPNTDAT